MDTLEIIKNKINSIKPENKQIHIKTVLIHIEQAKKFLKLGIKESESQYFTEDSGVWSMPHFCSVTVFANRSINTCLHKKVSYTLTLCAIGKRYV